MFGPSLQGCHAASTGGREACTSNPSGIPSPVSIRDRSVREMNGWGSGHPCPHTFHSHPRPLSAKRVRVAESVQSCVGRGLVVWQWAAPPERQRYCARTAGRGSALGMQVMGCLGIPHLCWTSVASGGPPLAAGRGCGASTLTPSRRLLFTRPASLLPACARFDLPYVSHSVCTFCPLPASPLFCGLTLHSLVCIGSVSC